MYLLCIQNDILHWNRSISWKTSIIQHLRPKISYYAEYSNWIIRMSNFLAQPNMSYQRGGAMRYTSCWYSHNITSNKYLKYFQVRGGTVMLKVYVICLSALYLHFENSIEGQTNLLAEKLMYFLATFPSSTCAVLHQALSLWFSYLQSIGWSHFKQKKIIKKIKWCRMQGIAPPTCHG